MRGKPSDCWKTLPELRITPADAGKTFRQIYSYRIGQDHPRGCGENCAGCAVQRLPVGSPPRMRGKLRSASAKDTKLRITPAGAGKTSAQHHGGVKWRDHPRRCGENTVRYKSLLTGKGSPPQVRGKPARTNRKSTKVRITPAGAGKTFPPV